MSYSSKQLALSIPERSKEVLRALILTEKVLLNKKFKKLMLNPNLGIDEKNIILNDIFVKYLDKKTINYLQFLLGYNGLLNFTNILSDYKDILQNQKIALSGTITTAKEITDAEILTAEKNLEENFKMPVVLDVKLNPRLIGGTILKIGSYTYNNSYENKLNKLR